ncbi:hypothetical protein JCM13267_14200 [Howardella ureilytica]
MFAGKLVISIFENYLKFDFNVYTGAFYFAINVIISYNIYLNLLNVLYGGYCEKSHLKT